MTRHCTLITNVVILLRWQHSSLMLPSFCLLQSQLATLRSRQAPWSLPLVTGRLTREACTVVRHYACSPLCPKQYAFFQSQSERQLHAVYFQCIMNTIC